jgi:hypothetical protein
MTPIHNKTIVEGSGTASAMMIGSIIYYPEKRVNQE